MIANQLEYNVTRTKAQKCRKAIQEMKDHPDPPANVHPRSWRAQREALESILAELQAELAEYDALATGAVTVVELDSISDLADGLVKARIIRGLSQQALAERLGMKVQQVQCYEADRYAGASLRRLGEVAEALGMRFEPRARMAVGVGESG